MIFVGKGLRHGLLDEETGVIRGRILLTVKREWGGLRVCVQDNGKGISSELLKRLNEPQTTWQSGGRHIGIPNIKKRLFFVFQERATIRIISGEGTRVELWCPLDRPEQR